jgi:hypothetical protein
MMVKAGPKDLPYHAGHSRSDFMLDRIRRLLQKLGESRHMKLTRRHEAQVRREVADLFTDAGVRLTDDSVRVLETMLGVIAVTG